MSDEKMMRESRKIDRFYVFGEKQFPLAVRRETTQGEMDFHSHEGFSELVIVHKGCGVHIFEDREYPISSGDVFVIKGPHLHAYRDTSKLCFFNVLYDFKGLRLPSWDISTVAGYQSLFEIEPKALGYGILESRFKLAVMELLYAEKIVIEMEQLLKKASVGFQFHSISLFCELIAFLSESYTFSENAGQNLPAQLGRLISYFEKNYSNRISISKMCEITNMSRTTLFRYFRQFFQSSPLDFLISLRVAKAGDLLASPDTDKSVSEISLMSGFPDSNYFSRKFREIMKISPCEFRGKYIREVAGRKQRQQNLNTT